MLKRHYLGYLIFGLGLIFLTAVLLSQTESVNSQGRPHSDEWVKPFALTTLCGDDCPPDFPATDQAAFTITSESDFDTVFDHQTCVQCHGDSISTDIDFLVSPQEMTTQMQARFLLVSKRVFALPSAQDDSQYHAMIDSYMQIHQQQISETGHNPTVVSSTLELLTKVEDLVNSIEDQNHQATIRVVVFVEQKDAVSVKNYRKCGLGVLCSQFIYNIIPPASSPEKHVSDTPILPIEIKWSVLRRGPPSASLLIQNISRRLQPFNSGRSSFVLDNPTVIPLLDYSFRCLQLTKEQPIEQAVVPVVKKLDLPVTASKHLEKSLR